MKAFFVYLLSSGVCLALFWALYEAVLRRSGYLRFNRAYLLSGLFIAVVLPLIRIRYDVPVTLPALFFAREHVPDAVAHIRPTISPWMIPGAVYGMGIAVLLLRDAFVCRRLLRMASKVSRHNGYRVVESPEVTAPMSLWRNVFINTHGITPAQREIIIEHEAEHIRQRHFIDLSLAYGATVMQWFNPFAWLYMSRVRENHEFLADRAVVRADNAAIYRATLLNYCFSGVVVAISNQFNTPKPFNRITMMTQKQKSPLRRAAVVTLVPIFGAAMWLSAEPRYVYNVAEPETVQADAPLLADQSAASTEATGEVKVTGYGPIAAPADESQLSKEARPRLILDGIELPFEFLQNIKPEHIECIEIYKDANAIHKFGKGMGKGVILVTTKSRAQTLTLPSFIRMLHSSVTGDPLILLDGVEGNKDDLESLSPQKIASIEVVKEASATEIYGEKGKNGVIFVTTKEHADGSGFLDSLKVRGADTRKTGNER